MAIVTYTRKAGTALTPEELAQIEEAAQVPYRYDEDCPLLAPEQLAEFRRAADTTEAERKQIALEGAQRRRQLAAVK
ncbi:MAG: hypothetical protein LBG90_01235 [Spirochaetaceae bacterium]|jgi:hypothetical protein|nr:hypothetical protein [Spirochaetaceae bacterium]